MWTIKLGLRLLASDRNLKFPIKTYPRGFERPVLMFNPSLLRQVCTPFTKNFHTSNAKWGHAGNTQHENMLAHEVMENNSSYSDIVTVHPSKTVSDGNLNLQLNVRKVFENFYLATFHNVKEQRSLEEEEFMGMVTSLARAIPSGSFHEIRIALFCLCLWQEYTRTSAPNFKLLWDRLDYACTNQLKDWSIAQKLLIADYWFHLRLSKYSLYNKNMINNLLRSSHQFTNSEFVHLMFCINLHRTVPHYFLDTLNKQLEKVASTVSIEELSIVCLGFSKADYKVNDKNILKIILYRTTSNIDYLDGVTVSRLLKFLRKSFHHQLIQHYVTLLKGCAINMERWNLPTAVHVSLLCRTANIFEPFLLDGIVEKVKENIATSRLKDMCKVVQSLSRFNYMPHSKFHESLFHEVMTAHRLEAARQHPRHLIHILLFYIYMGRYPSDLIEHILNPDFVSHCQRTCDKDVLMHLAVIDYCIEIECNKYVGPRLKPELLNVLQDNRGNLPTGSTRKNDPILLELLKGVTETLSSLTSPDNYTVRHVLPHMVNPVIIVKLSSKNPVPLQQIVNVCPPERILSPPTNELWGCLVTCGPFSFPFKSRQLCALIAMNVRQLKKLGYEVVLIPFQDFPSSDRYRKSYLKKKFDLLRLNIEDSALSTPEGNSRNYYESKKLA